MEKFLRDWRQDALNKHQYESAIFIGDKLLALTSGYALTALLQTLTDCWSADSDKDAFWLAQVHFSTGAYTRAQTCLKRDGLVENNPACKYLLAHCHVKQGNFDQALVVLGDKNPVYLIAAPGSARQKLRHVDGRVTNGASKKLAHRSDRVDRSEDREREDISNIRFEAAMCYLRGVCYAKQNAFDRAKECYKDAVRIDVQCFEAFDQLMKNSLMTPDEEWSFLGSLDFDTITVSSDSPSASQEAAQFTKMLYTTRLSKYSHPEELATATETLSTHYNLSANPDILLSRAESLFTTCRFRDALALTTTILQTSPDNLASLPIHLACLHELNEKNALFLLSHSLAQSHPDSPVAWLAVGVYYLTTNRIAEARRFFSKSSMMDPHFGPAWIGFAHTFAAEGEHDQAISAYSTAARLFSGSHLPPYPLLLNELATVFYHEDHLDESIRLFAHALELAASLGAEPAATVATRTNLGHALRRAGRFEEALAQFEDVLRTTANKDPAVCTAKGLVLLEMGEAWLAVVALHEALAGAPQDPIATELLGKALEVLEGVSVMGEEEEEEFERRLEGSRVEVMRRRQGRGQRGGGGGVREDGEGEESMMVDSEEEEDEEE
ncbi:anaphase-promoting complex subunit Cut9 [Coniosporium tulheliwenetii]|uniref:Anaphase-promoting complex subunit Cut9 n=1 Tax=Coniosporium tulheliwenetii TaxID=3383036 RepID=A0ACC2YY81_9PEZI|nr:anaphase-promoting complex subunit Cut9 [Cladosporium sp. JES 115]